MWFMHLVLLSMITITVEKWNFYRVYPPKSDENHEQLMFDCLPYDQFYNSILYDGIHSVVNNELLLYCVRLLNKFEYNMIDLEDIVEPMLTFDELQMANVTLKELYSWSAPLDMIEDYQIYLNTNISSDHDFFYNCTDPAWFGRYCQYTFGTNRYSSSLDDFVTGTFSRQIRENYRKFGTSVFLTDLSCYTHLVCYRGENFQVCLDWREICDGKIDCSNDGIDEKDCYQLETNECQENEYRCHDGQCIPDEFFRDHILNPDCLDGTDELQHEQYPALCAFDPSFRCENIKCYPSAELTLTCGDGQCSLNGCENKRDLLLKKAMFESTISLSSECKNLMVCLTGFIDCKTDLELSEHCPSVVMFPDMPVLLGNIKLIFSNEASISEKNGIILPSEICVDLPANSTNSENSTSQDSKVCRYFDELGLNVDLINSWESLLAAIYNQLKGHHLIPNLLCNHSDTLYHCNGTSKCISKHRLLDGIQDCPYNDDENYEDSCSLSDRKHRLECKDKCLSPINMLNERNNCPIVYNRYNIDKRDLKRRILFPTICDGVTEIDPPISINGVSHTDETECNYWLCNNTYTRCDGIWNCRTGEDELGCDSTPCPPLTQMCVSPENYTMFCLSINKAGDGIVDCLGASDERHLCRALHPEDIFTRFWCGNESQCISTLNVCDSEQDCYYGDDEKYCPGVRRTCSKSRENSAQYFLCALHDFAKDIFKPLSLEGSHIYPHIFDAFNSTEENEEKVMGEEDTRLNGDFSSVPNSLVAWAWYCHRGLAIFVRTSAVTHEKLCLCPPTYYGSRCEYQNERVSLTFQVRGTLEGRFIFAILFFLVGEDHHIHSHHQIEYNPTYDCKIKSNLYLLYSDRPKNRSKKYHVRVDVYVKNTLEHRASWLYPVKYPFMPVQRMAIQILIPGVTSKCSLNCGPKGRCSVYMNTKTEFCRCNSGWFGPKCNQSYICQCAPDSLCIRPSVCLCPLNQIGSRCYLTIHVCTPNPCMNGGICYHSNYLASSDKPLCICPKGFFGSRCENQDIQIDIYFSGIRVPESVFIHFISLEGRGYFESNKRTSMLKKIGIYQDSLTIYQRQSFEIIFIELSSNYYLIYLQEIFVPLLKISTVVIPSQRCLNIRELFNSTVTEMHLIRRIKYYHIPCQKRADLKCFYDDIQMCLCTIDQRANCFDFDHNMSYGCGDMNFCLHGGKCFQDNPYCSAEIECVCVDCFYGSRCQFSSEGINPTLDIIIGYHILPNISFFSQPMVIKIASILVMITVTIGAIDSILCFITFKKKILLKNGCGIYLLTTSISSFITMMLLAVKFWLLVLSQMNVISNQSFLKFQCISIDYLLRVFVTVIDWLHTCVAAERVVTVIQGASFDQAKSRKVSKLVIITISMLIASTFILDPIYRRLMVDEKEQRTFCLVEHTPFVRRFHSAVIFLYFLLPFSINISSVTSIIIVVAKRRSITQKQMDYRSHFRQQLKQHGHLIISSFALALLAVPRLIFVSLIGCMKSVRSPWLFLIGYCVSYIPSALKFIIFVVPSRVYRAEFRKTTGYTSAQVTRTRFT